MITITNQIRHRFWFDFEHDFLILSEGEISSKIRNDFWKKFHTPVDPWLTFQESSDIWQ